MSLLLSGNPYGFKQQSNQHNDLYILKNYILGTLVNPVFCRPNRSFISTLKILFKTIMLARQMIRKSITIKRCIYIVVNLQSQNGIEMSATIIDLTQMVVTDSSKQLILDSECHDLFFSIILINLSFYICYNKLVNSFKNYTSYNLYIKIYMLFSIFSFILFYIFFIFILYSFIHSFKVVNLW